MPYSVLIGNEMYRSFASLRMTTKRNRVILSEAKDLYESNLSNILKIPQLSVKNLFSFFLFDRHDISL